MCGAGVAMSISDNVTDWRGFVDQFAVEVQRVLNLNEFWMTGFHAQGTLSAKTAYVETIINEQWLGGGENRLLCHRMMAQPTLTHRDRAQILHAMGCLILTTNYDTVIEDSVPRERISMSHIDALKLAS